MERHEERVDYDIWTLTMECALRPKIIFSTAIELIDVATLINVRIYCTVKCGSLVCQVDQSPATANKSERP